MFFFNYHKGNPTAHLIAFKHGRARDLGPGQSLWYMPHATTLAAVPLISRDVPFIFNEATNDFQEVSIQGQLTYRINEPAKAAAAVDFTLDRRGRQVKPEDLDKLEQRLVNWVQANTRAGVNAMSLEQALTGVRGLKTDVLAALNAEANLQALGVIVENLHFNSVKATPEIRRALETDYREGLHKRADQAVYGRRYAAQEEERRLSQRELDTSIELEEKRKDLVELQAQNSLKLAEAEARAEELKLNPYGELAPQALVGLALKEWAAHAGSIDQLNISADMLSQLVTWIGNGKAREKAAPAE